MINNFIIHFIYSVIHAHRLIAAGAVGVVWIALLTMPVAAQDDGGGDPVAQDVGADGVSWTAQMGPEDGIESVSVDWVEEMSEGGVTMIALGVLSMALVMLSLERAWFLRCSRFVPDDLWATADEAVQQGEFLRATQRCEQSATPLGDALRVLIDHRLADTETTINLAHDLAMRRIEMEERRSAPLAVIAALAPLLGLLGTMIGMIEAFKLVEVFGDEGGASLLAGSISKALITTAAGLVIAVPAIVAYHLARHRVGTLSDEIELALEKAQARWVLAIPSPLQQTESSPLSKADAAAKVNAKPLEAVSTKPSEKGRDATKT